MAAMEKPDWKKVVGQRIGGTAGGRGRPPLHDHPPLRGNAMEDEVIAELAAHLEEVYEQARLQGLAKEDAVAHALQEVDDWSVLAAEIIRARSRNEERSMNEQRFRKLWLPALASITLTAVLLVVFDRIHASALTVGLGHLAMMLQLAWFAALPLLGQTKSEEALMNYRTRTIWLPGFVTLTAASLFLFAEEFVLMRDPSFYMTDLSLRPRQLVSGLPLWLYCAWLLAQVLCGSLGAFLSRRGGGTRLARIVAGAFPALMMFLLLALVVPISVLVERNAYVLSHPFVIVLGILIWAGGPAVALLIGALPFLRRTPEAAIQA